MIVDECKPRIAYVITQLDRGGCEMHLLEILPALSEWFSVQVFVLSHEAGDLKDLFQKRGILVTCLFTKKLSQRGRIIRFVWGAIKLHRAVSSGFDILHAFMPISYYTAGLTYLLGAKVKYFMMSRRALNHYACNKFLVSKLEQCLHRFISIGMGNSSEVSKQLVQEGLSPLKVRTVFNGVPLREYEDKQSVNLEDIPNGWARIGYVANFMPYKGHQDLIEVAHILLSLGYRKFCFVFAGKERYDIAKTMKQKIVLDGLTAHFKFLGEISHVQGVLDQLDLGVFPSHQEGFSNSLLEKMAQGLAVVATDVGGNKDAIISGESGYLVPPKEPTVLAEKLALLLSDAELRKRFGRAAQNRVHQLFTLERCISGYRDIYQKLLF